MPAVYYANDTYTIHHRVYYTQHYVELVDPSLVGHSTQLLLIFLLVGVGVDVVVIVVESDARNATAAVLAVVVMMVASLSTAVATKPTWHRACMQYARIFPSVARLSAKHVCLFSIRQRGPWLVVE